MMSWFERRRCLRHSLRPARLRRAAVAQQRRQAGFTIAEVAVAAAVLTIVALGFYTALTSGFGVLQASRENLRATQVMMQKLEGIRLCTWSELTNFTFSEPYNPISTTNAGVTYTGSMAIGPATNLTTNPSYQNNMCLVTVSLSWTNSNHGTPVAHTRAMQSEVARYGLQNYIWGAIK